MLKSAYVVRVYPDPVFYKGVEFVRHEAAVFGRFPSRRKAISVFRAIRRELGLNKERKFRKFHAAIDDILATKDLPKIPPGAPYAAKSMVLASYYFEGGHIEVEKMRVWW